MVFEKVCTYNNYAALSEAIPEKQEQDLQQGGTLKLAYIKQVAQL